MEQILGANTLKYAKEFSCAIAACGRVSDAEGALSCLEVMRRRGVAADLICYSAAVVACHHPPLATERNRAA